MTNKLQFISKIENGRLMPGIQAQIYLAVKNFEGKFLRITIEEAKKKRSLNQNSFYWGVVVQAVLQMFLDEGNDVDADEVHEYLKAHVGKLTKQLFTPDGSRLHTLCSTARLNTKEFEDYLEKIRAWAAGFGVVIPLPNEPLTV